MTNAALTTADKFVASKRYLGGIIQGATGLILRDWVLNSTVEEVAWFLMESLHQLGGDGRIATPDGKGLQPSATSGLNLRFSAGAAFVGGRLVLLDSAVDYDSDANFIAKGVVSTIDEIVAGSTYSLVDEDKLWSSAYQLPGCRVKMVDGDAAGSVFTIASLSGQRIILSGDASDVAVGDEYILLPPALAVGANKTIYLMTWIEDISQGEDLLLSSGAVADVTDSLTNTTPAHKRQVRWCFYAGATEAAGSDVLSSHYMIPVCTVTLDNGTIVAGDIADADTYISSGARSYAYELDAEAQFADHLGQIVDQQEVTEEQVVGFTMTNTPNFGMDGSDTLSLDNITVLTEWASASATPYLLYTVGTLELGPFATQSAFAVISCESDRSGAVAGADVGIFELRDADTDPEIEDYQLAAVAVHTNASTADVERAMPMGYIPVKQGLDWMVYNDGASHRPIKVLPGQIWDGAKMYQNPRQYVVEDLLDAAAYVGGVAPSNTWVYLYALATGSRRDLSFKCDTAAPLWNGEHPSVKGWCLGVIYKATSEVYVGSMYGDVFTFTDAGRLTLYTSSGSASTIAGGSFTIEPPPGAQSVQLEVSSTSDVAIAGTIVCIPQYTNDQAFRLRFKLGTTSDWSYVDVPGTAGDYSVTTGNPTGTGTFYVRVVGYRWSFGYVRDLETWED